MKFANNPYLWIPVRDYLVSSFFHIYIYIRFLSKEKAQSRLSPRIIFVLFDRYYLVHGVFTIILIATQTWREKQSDVK